MPPRSPANRSDANRSLVAAAVPAAVPTATASVGDTSNAITVSVVSAMARKIAGNTGPPRKPQPRQIPYASAFAANAVDLKADPPTTVSELSKVLGVADREGAQGRARLTKAKAATPAERELRLAMVAFSKKDSGWVANARGKLKAGVEPDIFLALVQREVDGSKQYVDAATTLRVRV